MREISTTIEQALNRKFKTSKDFEYLRQQIYIRLHELIGHNTLKRIWGIIDDGVSPRTSTLDILAKFLGYKDYNAFASKSGEQIDNSSPVFSRCINVEDDLEIGDEIRLIWLPNRICDAKYTGGNNFTVIYSENTRLRSGDTFRCAAIIEGEPLYISNLVQGSMPPVSYVCGKKTGVRYELKNLEEL
ncbi:MAG: hypothetical protein ACI31F_02770 [Muribaculaceae bacterium]